MKNKLIVLLIISIIYGIIYGIIFWSIREIPDELLGFRIWLRPLFLMVMPWFMVMILRSMNEDKLGIKNRLIWIILISNLGFIFYLFFRFLINGDYSDESDDLIGLAKISLILINSFTIFSLFCQYLLSRIFMKK